jgi:hypothetical protein
MPIWYIYDHLVNFKLISVYFYLVLCARINLASLDLTPEDMDFQGVRTIRPRTIRPHKLILAPPDSPPQVLGDESMPDWLPLS